MTGPKCPTPDKAAYFSREAAEHKLRMIWAQMIGQPRQRRIQTPCRTYLCECSRYHLTHTQLWPEETQP